MRTNNRWVIAIAGVFLQVALGAVYAWSVFRVPLAKRFGWSISEVTLTFTISIFVLGFAAFFGGLWLNRKGPRIVALTGGTLYGVGALAAFVSQYLRWHFNYLAGGAAFSGTGRSHRGGRSEHGRTGQYWQCSWTSVLGVDFRFDHETRNILRDVHWPGSVVLVLS